MPVLDQKQELAKKADLLTKQDTLIAGTGISIAADGKTISATGSGGSTVTVSPVLSTGTRIAAMEVDGTLYTLFAPTPPSVSVTQVQSSGTELARVVINGVSTSIYAPEGSTVLSGTTAPSAALGENNNIYVQYVDNSGTLSVVMTYVKLEGSWVQLTTGGGGGGNVDDVNVNGVSVVDANKVAQIVSYKEVTQAEYDALPASKLSDNILYCINDQMTADTTVAPIIYSEDEREVGVWTDGKPLYQKTFDIGAFPNTTTKSFAHNIANVDTIWVYDGFAYGSAGSYSLNRVTNDLQYQWETRVDDTYIYLQDFANFSNDFSAKVVLRYTKTTDQPGSGKYAPSGVPAVHYSENEQVVGTWVDGSTIYERVIEYTTPFTIANGSWYTSTESYTGISKIVNAWIINASGAIYNGTIVVIENDKLVIGNQTKDQPINNLKYVILRYTKITS